MLTAGIYSAIIREVKSVSKLFAQYTTQISTVIRYNFLLNKPLTILLVLTFFPTVYSLHVSNIFTVISIKNEDWAHNNGHSVMC